VNLTRRSEQTIAPCIGRNARRLRVSPATRAAFAAAPDRDSRLRSRREPRASFCHVETDHYPAAHQSRAKHTSFAAILRLFKRREELRERLHLIAAR
jgi:hypothetical protein